MASGPRAPRHRGEVVGAHVGLKPPRLLEALGGVVKGDPRQAFERHLLRFISMRTRIAVEDLAATVLFLASPAARHITGQLLGVDGNAEWEE